MSDVIIQKLSLTNFRNKSSASYTFTDGVNLIVGPNGVGKTNTLEAIYFLSSGSSFRADKDEETMFEPKLQGTANEVFDNLLLNHMYTRLSAVTINKDTADTIEISMVKNDQTKNILTKVFKVNGLKKRVTESFSYLNTVLFCPQDLELLTGSPSVRRKLMDTLLFKVDRNYRKEHIIYTKSLRQRNKVLEKIALTQRGYDELTFWSERLIESGNYLQKSRQAYLKEINPGVKEIYNEISDKNDSVEIEYKESLLTNETLKQHENAEIRTKTTLVGPHRDDFSISLNGYTLANYGSRGQQRTSILALKITELAKTEVISGTRPILLLDDIFSELDDAHISSLTKTIKTQQTLITATHSSIPYDNLITLE